MNFPLTLTAGATQQVERLLKKDGDPAAFLRVGVKGGGCSGFEYVMRLDRIEKPTDLVLQLGAVKVVCDPKSARLLQGSELQYTGNLIGGGFHVENPNAERSCGCGSSFTLKPGVLQDSVAS